MNTATIPSTPSSLPFPERRRWCRFPCEGHTYCRLIIDGVVDFWARRVQNLSTDGVKLLLDIPIPDGQKITLVLYHPGRRFSCQRQVRSVYSRQMGKCEFIQGAQFSQALTAQEMNELM